MRIDAKECLSDLQKNLEESILAKEKFFDEQAANLIKAAELCRKVLKAGNKILICGNGGSATDASHFAGEMLGRFVKEREALPVIFLGGDISAMTAIANDYGYEHVFSRQVDGLMKKGDVLIAISTSGNSKNVVSAAKVAEDRGYVIALTGGGGGKLAKIANINLTVSATATTARIQETHIFALHCLAELIEKEPNVRTK